MSLFLIGRQQCISEKIVSGQSIISKYKLKDHERIVLERVPDNPFYKDALYLERLAQVVKVVLDGKEVVVINTHLEAFDKTTRVKQFKSCNRDLFKKYAESSSNNIVRRL